MKQIIALFLFGSVISLVYGYEICGTPSGHLTNVLIDQCPDMSTRCKLKRGTNVTMTLEFTIDKEVTTSTAVVHGIILGIPKKFNLPNPDPCHDCGLTCPLAPSAGTFVYSTQLPVLKIYPRVTVDVKWQLKDQDGNDMVCVLIPAKLV